MVLPWPAAGAAAAIAGANPKTPTAVSTAASPVVNGIKVPRRNRCDTLVRFLLGGWPRLRWRWSAGYVIVPCTRPRRNASWPNCWRCHGNRYPRAGRQAQPLGRVSAVHRDGDEPSAIRIGDKLPRRDSAEHIPVRDDQPVAAAADERARARLEADFRGVGGGNGELDIAEAVYGQNLAFGDRIADQPFRGRQRDQIRDVDFRSGRGQFHLTR